jgi:cytoskeletal protein CcmA (bactofilin family)
LSGKSKGARYSESRTDTILGPGVRIDGNIAFAGVLRTQGEIMGDISCDADPNGTIVVAKSGNVTGTIKAAHLIVNGRVNGDVHASESVEIQQGACVVGDVFYKAIAIHPGGVVEGVLTQRVPVDAGPVGQEAEIPEIPEIDDTPAVSEHDLPLADAARAGSSLGARSRNWRKMGVALAVAAVVVAVMLANRNPTAATAPVADESPKASLSATPIPAAASAPAESPVARETPKAVAEAAVAPAPRRDEQVREVVQAPPPQQREISPEQVTTVHGDTPSKSADFLFVTSKEPCTLFKKKRQDPGEGTRVEVAQGSKKRISITHDDMLRVAKGQDVDIFYQGRKVGANTIQSGTWMNFVPHSASGADGKE